jgi:hypothetical protein
MTVQELMEELSNYDGNHEINIRLEDAIWSFDFVSVYLEELGEDDHPECPTDVVFLIKQK